MRERERESSLPWEANTGIWQKWKPWICQNRIEKMKKDRVMISFKISSLLFLLRDCFSYFLLPMMKKKKSVELSRLAQSEFS